MKHRALSVALASLALAACGGVFESSLAPPQTYVLRLPTPAGSAAEPTAGTLLVLRPEAGPGLESERIALLRSDRRLDYYAASRWAAPVPDLVESVLVDALRGTGRFAAVLDDASPFAPRYDLRVTLRRFEADYTAGGEPTVQVVFECTLGRRRDRTLLSSFTASGSARASDDRLGAVVAAFETATGSAVNEIIAATGAAIAAEPPAVAPASEGR
jgi:cholesterol transport system auxiliary component